MCISLPDIGDAVSTVVVSNIGADDTVGVITVDFDVVSTLAKVVTAKPTYMIYIRSYMKIPTLIKSIL